MLFNSNVKLLVVLILLVVLVHMLNQAEPVQNDGELELLSEDQVIDTPTVSENTPVDDAVVGEILDQSSTNTIKPEGTNIQSTNIDNDETIIDSVLNTDVTGNDLGQPVVANVTDDTSSVTAQNMQKLMEENEKNKLDFKASELLPNEVNKDWFETDFSHAQINVNNDNLVVTDKYVIGVNTVGQSLKNASYDIRAQPPCPKFTVSPWNQSTIEPDFNIKNIME
tara:strand:+ start:63 stop:734 length:672 start_codon:yes stop_codon:yes gene_type:complete